jgi:hypothetical protein
MSGRGEDRQHTDGHGHAIELSGRMFCCIAYAFSGVVDDHEEVEVE